MKYVVTGAAGFIGSHLSRALLDAGHEVVAVDSFSDYYDPARKEENAVGLGVVRADFAVDPVDALLAGADGVFHLAGQPGVRAFGQAFPDYLTRNVLATQRLFEAAAKAQVKVVFASSSSIYGDAETYPTPEATLPRPNSPYGITKLACEHLAGAYARSFGLETVGLRYFTVYGPRQRPDMAFTRIAEALAERRPFELYGDGGQSRSFTYVTDVGRGHDRRDGLGSRRASSTTSAAATEASLSEAIAVCRAGRGTRARSCERHAAAAGDVRRTKARTSRTGRLRSGLAPVRPHSRKGCSAQWDWAAARVAARMSEVQANPAVSSSTPSSEVDFGRLGVVPHQVDRWWMPRRLGLVARRPARLVLASVRGGDHRLLRPGDCSTSASRSPRAAAARSRTLAHQPEDRAAR